MRYMLFIILLSGCSVNPTRNEAPSTNLPAPTISKMNMKEVKFHGIDTSFCLTPDYYENLSANMADIKRYIKEQQLVIKYYELSPTPKRK